MLLPIIKAGGLFAGAKQIKEGSRGVHASPCETRSSSRQSTKHGRTLHLQRREQLEEVVPVL